MDLTSAMRRPIEQDARYYEHSANPTRTARSAGTPRAKSNASQKNSPPATPAQGAGTGPLRGLTSNELDHLAQTYGIQGQQDDRSKTPLLVADAENAKKMANAAVQDLKGYPPDIARFEPRFADLLGQIAVLPANEMQAYGASAATLHSAYQIATPEERATLSDQFGKLEKAVHDEYNRAISDPLQRVLGVFNKPAGAGYLDKEGQYRISLLANMRHRFLGATTPEQRDSVLKSALSLKTRLQAQVSDAIGRYSAKEAASWKEADKDIDRILTEAEAVKNDPGKRYEVIARQLHTSNPGSGEDPFEDRRILAFTQRMQDDPALRDKLSKWYTDAAKPLNSYAVGGPKRYQDILDDLPAAGPDYVRDLADRYDAVLNDATTKNRSITPEERAKRLAGQILEGTARVLLGLTPLAPLSSALDEHSLLPPGARIGIDLAANVVGMAIDPANAASEAFAEGKLFSQAIKQIDHAATEIGGGAKEIAGAAAKANQPLSPALLSRDIGLEQRIAGRPIGVPTEYASEIAPSSMKPSPDVPGLLVDDNNQTYVPIDGRAYPVYKDNDYQTYRVYDPDNRFRYGYPVRRNANNQWEVHGDIGLKGGAGDDAQAGPSSGVAGAGPSSSSGMSHDLRTALEVEDWKSDSDALLDDEVYKQTYKNAYQRLSADQKKIINQWTAVDEGSSSESGSGSDSDSGSSTGSGTSGGSAGSSKNYELNQALYTNKPYDGMAKDVKNLTDGLTALPASPKEVKLLRVADVPADYASRFKPGDLVTNSPAFMSASSDKQFATYAMWDQAAVAGTEQPAIAVYDIRATSPRPFIYGMTTKASAEREWLFRPNSLFRVEEVGIRPPTSPEEKPRIGLRLVEIPVTKKEVARNIYTGETVEVKPEGPTAEEVVAGPPPAKKQKTA
jgi:hypothetical protein